MDKVPTENAALVRCIVRRTLTVVGGSIAGTAIAWAISSASASADATCEVPRLAPALGLSELADADRQRLRPVPDLVCVVEHVVPVYPDRNLITQADDVSGSVTDQIGRVPETLIGHLGQSDRPRARPGPVGGAHEPPSLARPADGPSAAAPTPTIGHPAGPGTVATGHATERAAGEGMSRRGSPEPAPLAPPKPSALPGAPAGVPTSGSTGHPGGGTDSPAFAALPWAHARLGMSAGHPPPIGDLGVADEPGTQPGVTPD